MSDLDPSFYYVRVRGEWVPKPEATDMIQSHARRTGSDE